MSEPNPCTRASQGPAFEICINSENELVTVKATKKASWRSACSERGSNRFQPNTKMLWKPAAHRHQPLRGADEDQRRQRRTRAIFDVMLKVCAAVRLREQSASDRCAAGPAPSSRLAFDVDTCTVGGPIGFNGGNLKPAGVRTKVGQQTFGSHPPGLLRVARHRWTSALGHKRTFRSAIVMSALSPKADIEHVLAHVRYGPIANMRRWSLVSTSFVRLQTPS